MELELNKVRKLVKEALQEDLAGGDITSEAIISSGRAARAVIIAKAKGIIAGLPVAEEVFKSLDPAVKFKALVNEGSQVKPGTKVAEVKGKARAVLATERTALNFLQRLSGIATLTAEFVRKVRGTRARIMDTRKTTPLLRMLEKYAVSVGGGINHRQGLYEAVLIKDNHIKVVGDLFEAVRLARRALKADFPIEVEAGNLEEVKEAIDAGADILLLDNMHPRALRTAVDLVREYNRRVGVVGARLLTEASGGINLRNVRRVAKTGVDAISIGALTHSARALDLSLEVL